MESQESDDPNLSRKTPIERLSKEELLKKYRAAILIAQKAKESKAEFLKHISQHENVIKALEDKLQKAEEGKKMEADLRAEIENELQDARQVIHNMQEGRVQENYNVFMMKDRNCPEEVRLERHGEATLLHETPAQKDVSSQSEERHSTDMKEKLHENSLLSMELEECKVKISNQEAEILDIKSELNGLNDLKYQLEKSLTEKENEIKSLLEQISNDKEIYRNSQSELECRIQNLDESLQIERVKTMKKNMENMSTIKNLEELLLSKEDDIKRQAESVNEMRCKFEKIQEEVSDKQSILNESENKVGELVCLVEQYKETLNKLSDDKTVSTLTGKISQLDCEIVLRDEEISHLKDKVTEISSELHNSNSNLENLKLLSSEHCSEIEHLQKESNSLSVKVLSLETEKSELQSRVEELKNTLQNQLANDTVSKLTDENINLQKEILRKEEEINEKENTITQLSSQLQEMKDENSEMLEHQNDNVAELEAQLKEALDDLLCKKNLLKETKETVSLLECQVQTLNNTLKEGNQKVEVSAQELDELRIDLFQRKKEIQCRDETITQLKIELDQIRNDSQSLMAQVSDMTQHLEDAKELVKKREKEVFEFQHNSTVATKLQQELSEQLHSLQNILHVKESLIQDLEQEVSKLKDAAANESTNTEVSSTFSLSRTEELSRMRDLEDSFEDKYTKLRVVAVKLKKRVTDLTQTLEIERSKMAAEKSDLQAKLAQVASHSKTVQTLQSEVDRLQDLLEEQKKTQIQLSKDLESAVREAASSKFDLASAREEILCLTSDKKSLESKISNLDATLSNSDSLRNEVEKLLLDLKEKDLLLENMKEQNNNLSEQLEKVCADAKKKSVLSLEMADMEKSVSELNRQLSSERDSLKKTKEELEQEHSSSLALQSKVKELEGKITIKEAACEELKDALALMKEDSDHIRKKCKEKEIAVEELTIQLEKQRSQVEELNLQCSELVAMQAQIKENARQQIETLSRQVYQLEEQCTLLKETNKALDDELTSVRTNFENYKVRAQSVLRQSAKQEDRSVSSSTVHDAKELEVEVERLRVNMSTLNANLKQTTSQLQAALQDVNAEREEKLRAIKQTQSLKESCAQAIERQHAAEERLCLIIEESKQAKLHAETLVQCYKQQIEDLKATHQKKVATLTEQLENLQESITKASDAPTKCDHIPSVPYNSSPVADWAVHTQSVSPPDPDLALRLSSLQREEGEGSESVDSFPSRRISVTTQERRHELVPLDKLLSSTTYPEADMRDVTRADSSDMNVELLQSKLNACESRASHLTALLSEAEGDAARLSQLNDVLKEEIRRQQRSEERAQHAHNLEYLKNIVVKFITLQSGDERQRLVPVLNTILKLSPEEAGLVATVAKGSAQTSGAARGWGSYLPLPGWSGS